VTRGGTRKVIRRDPRGRGGGIAAVIGWARMLVYAFWVEREPGVHVVHLVFECGAEPSLLRSERGLDRPVVDPARDRRAQPVAPHPQGAGLEVVDDLS
jgi:hypothetical protein